VLRYLISSRLLTRATVRSPDNNTWGGKRRSASSRRPVALRKN